jgi:hypothetical protein
MRSRGGKDEPGHCCLCVGGGSGGESGEGVEGESGVEERSGRVDEGGRERGKEGSCEGARKTNRVSGKSAE